ncbi:MAG: DUF2087 domain-containing protein [Dehalobacterium sp.]
MNKVEKKINISHFLDADGKIGQIPAANKKKMAVLDYLCGKFEQERIYSEKEVNGIINVWHTFGDYFILRRLLIDHKFLERTPNGEKYWAVKKEDEKDGDI